MKHNKSNKNDIMYVREYLSKRGELSYQLFCSGKDAFTKEYKVYVKSFKVPPHIRTESEKKQFRIKCQLEWKEEVEKKSKGILANNGGKICFYDYAEECVENILVNNPESYNHYAHSKWNLKIFKNKFGRLNLDEITPPVVRNFRNWLCTRTYKKETIVVKKDLKEVIREKGLAFKDVCLGCNISNATLCVALKVGNKICKNTALSICKFLNVKFETYFDLTSKDVQFSKSANKSLMSMLHSVLAQAVKELLITENYASSKFVDPVIGTEGERQIFEDDEVEEFVEKANKEEDARKKIAFFIGLNLGVRGAEMAGLEWKDIDFELEKISINKNTMYVSGFGIVTKGTKNESSKREVDIPPNLVILLKLYKNWWDKKKLNHGDLWTTTDRLFVQDCGKNMSNQTINRWLTKFEEKNNLKHVTIHGLRSTNITLQVTNGIDIKTVAVIVGHKYTETTLDVYAKATKKSKKEACLIIDKIISGKLKDAVI